MLVLSSGAEWGQLSLQFMVCAYWANFISYLLEIHPLGSQPPDGCQAGKGLAAHEAWIGWASAWPRDSLLKLGAMDTPDTP
jgi:hypothetical protein